MANNYAHLAGKFVVPEEFTYDAYAEARQHGIIRDMPRCNVYQPDVRINSNILTVDADILKRSYAIISGRCVEVTGDPGTLGAESKHVLYEEKYLIERASLNPTLEDIMQCYTSYDSELYVLDEKFIKCEAGTFVIMDGKLYNVSLCDGEECTCTISSEQIARYCLAHKCGIPSTANTTGAYIEVPYKDTMYRLYFNRLNNYKNDLMNEHLQDAITDTWNQLTLACNGDIPVESILHGLI